MLADSSYLQVPGGGGAGELAVLPHHLQRQGCHRADLGDAPSLCAPRLVGAQPPLIPNT